MELKDRHIFLTTSHPTINASVIIPNNIRGLGPDNVVVITDTGKEEKEFGKYVAGFLKTTCTENPELDNTNSISYKDALKLARKLKIEGIAIVLIVSYKLYCKIYHGYYLEQQSKGGETTFEIFTLP